MKESHRRTLLVKAKIPAGAPQPIATLVEHIDLNTFFVPHDALLLQCTGDSMLDADICEGDWIMISQSKIPVNGSIVVARLNDTDFTIKRWKMDEQRLYLVPANGALKPREITEDDNCEVVGVLEWVFRRAI